jgi:DNA-binding transcriptional LysR family regulator
MRQEWIEDILAIIEHGSLQKACEQRFLTQPAFSRRVQAIEAHLRMPILDRSTKPARVRPEVVRLRDRMQELAWGLRNLNNELRQQAAEPQRPVVLVSQHSITASYGSPLIALLNPQAQERITLRSENWDACFTLLTTGEADIAITYGMPDISPLLDGGLIEQQRIGSERLMPVFATEHLRQLNQWFARGELPIIAYPNEVFMGTVMARHILPRVDSQDYVRRKTETALTIAGLHLAIAGLGVAWVPQNLAQRALDEGKLTDMSDNLPSTELSIIAMRLRGEVAERKARVWQAILGAEL